MKSDVFQSDLAELGATCAAQAGGWCGRGVGAILDGDQGIARRGLLGMALQDE